MKAKIFSACFWLFSLGISAAELQADGQSLAGNAPLATIEALDVPRYMGTWYEIAKFPNLFQKKCVGNTKARYTLREDGSVEVVNACRLKEGAITEAVGSARQIGSASSPKLEVRFAPAWLSFIPAVWGNYWVVDLDEGYQLVAVSEPKREYLWILSRTPSVDKRAYDSLLERLGHKGFDIEKLEASRQD